MTTPAIIWCVAISVWPSHGPCCRACETTPGPDVASQPCCAGCSGAMAAEPLSLQAGGTPYRHWHCSWIGSSPAFSCLLKVGCSPRRCLLDRRSRPRARPLRAGALVPHGGVNCRPGSAKTLNQPLTWPSKVVGLASFLLIVGPQSAKSLWIGLLTCWWQHRDAAFPDRNLRRCTRSSGSFRLMRIWPVPPASAMPLILVGLLTKAGLVCVRSCWLPPPMPSRQAESPPCSPGWL